MLRKLLIMAIVGMVFLSGCRSAAEHTSYINPNVDFSYIKSVAVLPFNNLTSDRNADEIIRQMVINEMLATGYVDVAVPGQVLTAIAQKDVRTISSPNAEQIKSVGQALKVQAVIFGSVEQYAEVRSGNVSAPEVTVTIMMADTEAGTIIWSVTQTSGGASFATRHFGARGDTLSETALKVVRAAIRTLAEY